MTGRGMLPAPVLAAVAPRAVVRTIVHPGMSPPERGYRPSAKLDEFVRCRDMTCRFPSCDVPAWRCDIDHTISYPAGPTLAANLKCLCRTHHLCKTFWGGSGGWQDRQLPDGTVVWTSPGGLTHVTEPGSRLQFPSLCRPTAAAVPRGDAVAATGLTMPRRARTRVQDRAARIDAERARNAAAGAAPARRPGLEDPWWRPVPEDSDDPPPF